MFYEPRNGHGLPHDPFKAIVAPRPIGWITSMSAAGDDQSRALFLFQRREQPRRRCVMFSSEGRKDSRQLHRGDRRIRLQSRDLGSARGDERDLGALPARHERDGKGRASKPRPAASSSRRASQPRPARSNASCCRSCRCSDVDGEPLDCHVVFGQVVGVHIDDRFIKDGLLDTAAMKPIARCGYHNYAVVERQFSMIRPTA